MIKRYNQRWKSCSIWTFQNKSTLCWLMFCISFNCEAGVTYIKVIPLPQPTSIKRWAAWQMQQWKVLMYICLPERYIACPINLSVTTCIILSAVTLNSTETQCSSTLTIQPCLKEFFKDFAPYHEAGFVGQKYTVRNSCSNVTSSDNQNLVTDNLFIWTFFNVCAY